jgi:hypothetical protein
MAEADPYINRASADIRKPLQLMVAESVRHEGELAALLSDMGSTPAPTAVRLEHQYMAFLTLEFLLPKLREDKLQSIDRYEKTLALLADADPAAADLLRSHLEDHRRDVAFLGTVIGE